MSSSILGNFQKQPAEVESYTINYSDDLTDGDNVQSATATVSGADAALVVQNTFVEDPRVRMFIAGGTDGVTYKITVVMVTADGRTLEDEFKIKVKEV